MSKRKQYIRNKAEQYYSQGLSLAEAIERLDGEISAGLSKAERGLVEAVYRDLERQKRLAEAEARGPVAGEVILNPTTLTLYVKFYEVPTAAQRNRLKEAGFRWNPYAVVPGRTLSGAWEHKARPDTIEVALAAAQADAVLVPADYPDIFEAMQAKGYRVKLMEV